MSDFEPTIVYRVPGPHFGPNGKTYEYKGINSIGELNDALSGGWSHNIMSAIESSAEKQKETNNNTSTRAELEEKARELNIKFDGRTSDDKLAAKIEVMQNGLDKT